MSATIDLPRYGELFGIGRSATYKAAAKGDLPTPVFRIGGRYVAPVAPIAEMLGLTPDEVRGVTVKDAA